MNETGMNLWMEKVQAKRSGALFKKPAMLVWDLFKAHKIESNKKLLKGMNKEIALIYESLTSQLQPLDVSIDKPF